METKLRASRPLPRTSIEDHEEQDLKGSYAQYIYGQEREAKDEWPGLRQLVIVGGRDLFRSRCGWDSLRKFPINEIDKSLEVVATLGNGSLGLVEEVKWMGQDTLSFARKRVFLPYSRRRQLLSIVRQEAKVIKELVHTHIIHIFGTYESTPRTGLPTFSLLMFPVAEEDLAAFLHNLFDENVSTNEVHGIRRSWLRGWFASEQKKGWLRLWFSCLSTALEYIHQEGVRHQDIKPSNIVHLGEHIFFTDFSSASKFSPGATTSTENPARTSAMYCAPEMLQSDEDDQYGRHGTKSDIFSLGCVFVEMLVAINDIKVSDLYERIQLFPAPGGIRYARDKGPLEEIIMDNCDRDSYSIWKKVVQPMLEHDRKRRPSAGQVVQTLRDCSSWTAPCKCAPTYLPGYLE